MSEWQRLILAKLAGIVFRVSNIERLRSVKNLKNRLVQLTMYGVVAASVIAGLWWLEHQRRAKVAAEQPVPRLLRLRESARGPSPPHEYLRDEIVRVTAPAVAKVSDGDWVVIQPDSLLRVLRTRLAEDQPWISVTTAEQLPAPALAAGTLSAGATLELHASFLERWRATEVDGLLEVAGYKLLETAFMGAKGNIVRGLLRNRSDGELRDCVVTARFFDGAGNAFAQRQTTLSSIGPRQIVEFKTPSLAARFDRLTLRVAFTDRDGKRHESSEIPLLALPKVD
jgi:hypothetical protein